MSPVYEESMLLTATTYNVQINGNTSARRRPDSFSDPTFPKTVRPTAKMTENSTHDALLILGVDQSPKVSSGLEKTGMLRHSNLCRAIPEVICSLLISFSIQFNHTTICKLPDFSKNIFASGGSIQQ